MNKKPMKKKTKIIIAIFAIIVLFGAFGGNSKESASLQETVPEIESPVAVENEPTIEETVQNPEITMYSNDTVGATRHTIVGMDDYEPSGKYKIVCTEGHGEIHINEAERFLFAADDKKGTEFDGSQVFYEESLEIELKGNDEIMARNHNSSQFKLEFYIVE